MKIAGAVALLIAAAALYFAGQRDNPPGFYRDEASVAYNAMTIAQHGVDEHGQHFPLFFRAFGEYKNPTFIYVLAGVFRVAGASNVVARRTAAACVFLASLVMALLAWHMTARPWIAAATFLTALFTPALFEVGRLAFEVACFPLVLALFLMAAHLASIRARWSAGIVVALALTLVLMTFTYTVGRLLAPMLLLGLVLFLTPPRRTGYLGVALLYAAGGVLPLLAFQRAHEAALTGRFMNLTYAGDSSLFGIAAQFVRHFALNLIPIGDPNPRHHMPDSGPSVLLVTIVFALVAAWFAIRERNRWLLFLCYGTLCAAVPASLTTDDHHVLRLIAYPILLIALSIAGMHRIRSAPALALLLILGLAQSAFFLVEFHRRGIDRAGAFDTGAKPVVESLLTLRQRPVYLQDGPLYALAWWHASQRGVDRSAFSVLPPGGFPPPASLLMSSGDCMSCTVIARSGEFRGYRTAGVPTSAPPRPSP